VRYLEKAFTSLDAGQLKLVFEALHERRRLLANAPHLTASLPIMMPCYRWWEVPYFWAGLKAYDAVAGTAGLTMSRFVSAAEARRQFPTLAEKGPGGHSLKGTIVYYDGQFDDARLNLSLALTAALAGATVLNYAEVVDLLRDPETGRVCGALVRDGLAGGRPIPVHARQVINATGPAADGLRKLADADATPMIMPSAGVHVALPDYYSPDRTGLIVPKTADGRVVFLLPWQDATIAGTTDAPATVGRDPPVAHEDEVAFILDAIRPYLTVDVRRSDVQSAWSGIRPLAIDPRAADTASASRDHVVALEADGLLTVSGGKWTTYRLMAEDAIDAAVEAGGLGGGSGGGGGNKPAVRPCRTRRLPLVGAVGYSPALFTEVAQNYTVPHRPGAIDTRVAKHLAASYCDRARAVTRLAEAAGLGRRLTRGHPEIEAEVVYAATHEFCETAEDFLARRTRMAFVDVAAAEQALPRVVELLSEAKGWGWWRTRREAAAARAFLETFKGAPASEHKKVAEVGRVVEAAAAEKEKEKAEEKEKEAGTQEG
jgi:glycerol-3-phosphate dehydrogenase